MVVTCLQLNSSVRSQTSVFTHNVAQMTASLIPRPFWNDGGPLLILPPEAARAWEGGDEPSGGRVVTAHFRATEAAAPATDYDRACDAPDTATVIAIGDSWGIVLGTAAAQSAQWLPGWQQDAFYVLGIEALYDASQDRLRRLIDAQLPSSWRTLLAAVEVGAGGLLLMHAADRPTEIREHSALRDVEPSDAPGAVIGEGLRFSASPGTYEIAACDVVTPEEEHLTFVRFRCIAPAT